MTSHKRFEILSPMTLLHFAAAGHIFRIFAVLGEFVVKIVNPDRFFFVWLF